MGHSSPETSKVPGTKMIYRMFGVIETLVLNVFDGLMRFSSSSTVKAVSLVVFGVISEIFMYMVLGLCCVFISLIIQVHDIIEKNEEKPAESALAEPEMIESS